jgi:hypothetical protein
MASFVCGRLPGVSGFEGAGPTARVTFTRRSALAGIGFLPLLRYVSPGTVAAAFQQQPSELRFFTEHEAAVVTEATARLIPGPLDDPSEESHPGAREAGVVHYIDLFLSAFDEDPPRVYATGPWSGRHGGSEEMGRFLALAPWQEQVWRERINELQVQYREGTAALDKAAGGDFASAAPEDQDRVLVELGGDGFRRTLFEHAIEGTYAAPEYGGNRELSGWIEIDYAGDVAPEGYPPDEVSAEVIDAVPADQVLPFPPDMAETGTDDPLGGQTLGEARVPGGVRGLIGDIDPWFTAASPGIVRAQYRRSSRRP